MPVCKGIILAVTLCFSWNAVAQAVELNWSGCEISRTAYINDLAPAFEAQTGTRINLPAGTDSTDGIHDVHSGIADIGSTSRDTLAHDQQETGVELVPVAWNALRIIVNRDNPVTSLSLEQLQAIFSGKITNWSELGGDKQNIEVYVYQIDNSAAGRIREILFADSRTTLKSSRTFDVTESLELALTKNPHAIAISGNSLAATATVKIVAVDDVMPSVTTLKSGDYGLYSPLYLAYNPSSSKIDSIRDFVIYLNSKPARDIMRSNGIVPYTEALSLVMKKVRDNEASYPLTVDKL
ncbi:MAG: substrate-binding domain-containing protein [Gammaproteobacteria bacterium]|jgi:phosphate transport system substrate-binding protein